jgi:hypothetical protein
MKTTYLNTDLELRAPCDLSPLAEALTQDGLLIALHVLTRPDGSGSARFETTTGFQELDVNLAAMLTVIEALPEPTRRLWSDCTERVFDIGYEIGTEGGPFSQQLRAITIERIAAARVSIMLTIYRPTAEDNSQACRVPTQ